MSLLDAEESVALSALFKLALRCLREHAHEDQEVARLGAEASPLVFRLQAEIHAMTPPSGPVH